MTQPTIEDLMVISFEESLSDYFADALRESEDAINWSAALENNLQLFDLTQYEVPRGDSEPPF